mgnify:CR=1 FL=1
MICKNVVTINIGVGVDADVVISSHEKSNDENKELVQEIKNLY